MAKEGLKPLAVKRRLPFKGFDTAIEIMGVVMKTSAQAAGEWCNRPIKLKGVQHVKFGWRDQKAGLLTITPPIVSPKTNIEHSFPGSAHAASSH